MHVFCFVVAGFVVVVFEGDGFVAPVLSSLHIDIYTCVVRTKCVLRGGLIKV